MRIGPSTLPPHPAPIHPSHPIHATPIHPTANSQCTSVCTLRTVAERTYYNVRNVFASALRHSHPTLTPIHPSPPTSVSSQCTSVGGILCIVFRDHELRRIRIFTLVVNSTRIRAPCEREYSWDTNTCFWHMPIKKAWRMGGYSSHCVHHVLCKQTFWRAAAV